MTADVDVVVGTDVEGALRLLEVLDDSSFTPLFDGVEEVVTQAFILPLRHRATHVKVDLAIGLSGFEQQLIRRSAYRSGRPIGQVGNCRGLTDTENTGWTSSRSTGCSRNRDGARRFARLGILSENCPRTWAGSGYRFDCSP